MFGRKRSTSEDGAGAGGAYGGRDVVAARGGVSLWAVLTGVVVSFGALFLLSALVGGILAATGVDTGSVEGQTEEVGVGVGIAVVVAWFLACLWGGYTAGRMGRGAGAVNGLLVPIAVIVIGLVVAGVVSALGASANLNLPFSDDYRLPTDRSNLIDLGVGFGIGTLVAMLVGGLFGGLLGPRWHTKLDRRKLEEQRREGSPRQPVAPAQTPHREPPSTSSTVVAPASHAAGAETRVTPTQPVERGPDGVDRLDTPPSDDTPPTERRY